MTVDELPIEPPVRQSASGFRHILHEGFERSSGWMHLIAVMFAFMSDFLKKVLPHCTIGLFVCALLAFLVLLFIVRSRLLRAETAAAVIIFFLSTAILSGAVLGLQRWLGDPPDGAAVALAPQLKPLQKKLDGILKTLNVIEAKQDFVISGQEKTNAMLAQLLEPGPADLPLPRPCSGQKLCIVVATLEDDAKNRAQTKHIKESLDDVFHANLPGSAVSVLEVPRQIREGFGGDDAANAAATQKNGRDLLTLLHGDVLIYGRVAGADKVLRISLLAGETQLRGRSYLLDQAYSLPPDFNTELGAALGAVAAAMAAPSYDLDSRFVADALRPTASRLDRLVQTRPDGLNDREYAAILTAYADCKTAIGAQSGDAAMLKQAGAAYNKALALRTPGTAVWADTQNNLGIALRRLGEQTGDVETLQQAVDAWRNALSVYPVGSRDWADAQSGLSTGLVSLAERNGDLDLARRAIEAARAALGAETAGTPEWAHAQGNLGVALLELGERQHDRTLLKEAAEADRAALLAYVPGSPAWAGAQNNLGNVLRDLGAGEDPKLVQQAIDAHRSALRASRPGMTDWATAQNNLAAALVVLGEMRRDPRLLSQAIDAGEAALRVTPPRTPPWAGTQVNLAAALLELGEGSPNGADLLRRAADAAAEASDIYKPGTKEWLTAKTQMGIALLDLGEQKNDTVVLQQAGDAFDETLRFQIHGTLPWAVAEINFGSALLDLGELKEKPELFKVAIEAENAALGAAAIKDHPELQHAASSRLSRAKQDLAKAGTLTSPRLP